MLDQLSGSVRRQQHFSELEHQASFPPSGPADRHGNLVMPVQTMENDRARPDRPAEVTGTHHFHRTIWSTPDRIDGAAAIPEAERQAHSRRSHARACLSRALTSLKLPVCMPEGVLGNARGKFENNQ